MTTNLFGSNSEFDVSSNFQRRMPIERIKRTGVTFKDCENMSDPSTGEMFTKDNPPDIVIRFIDNRDIEGLSLKNVNRLKDIRCSDIIGFKKSFAEALNPFIERYYLWRKLNLNKEIEENGENGAKDLSMEVFRLPGYPIHFIMNRWDDIPKDNFRYIGIPLFKQPKMVTFIDTFTNGRMLRRQIWYIIPENELSVPGLTSLYYKLEQRFGSPKNLINFGMSEVEIIEKIQMYMGSVPPNYETVLPPAIDSQNVPKVTLVKSIGLPDALIHSDVSQNIPKPVYDEGWMDFLSELKGSNFKIISLAAGITQINIKLETEEIIYLRDGSIYEIAFDSSENRIIKENIGNLSIMKSISDGSLVVKNDENKVSFVRGQTTQIINFISKFMPNIRDYFISSDSKTIYVITDIYIYMYSISSRKILDQYSIKEYGDNTIVYSRKLDMLALCVPGYIMLFEFKDKISVINYKFFFENIPDDLFFGSRYIGGYDRSTGTFKMIKYNSIDKIMETDSLITKKFSSPIPDRVTFLFGNRIIIFSDGKQTNIIINKIRYKLPPGEYIRQMSFGEKTFTILTQENLYAGRIY